MTSLKSDIHLKWPLSGGPGPGNAKPVVGAVIHRRRLPHIQLRDSKVSLSTAQQCLFQLSHHCIKVLSIVHAHSYWFRFPLFKALVSGSATTWRNL